MTINNLEKKVKETEDYVTELRGMLGHVSAVNEETGGVGLVRGVESLFRKSIMKEIEELFFRINSTYNSGIRRIEGDNFSFLKTQRSAPPPPVRLPNIPMTPTSYFSYSYKRINEDV